MTDRSQNTNNVFIFLFCFTLAVFISSFITVSPLSAVFLLLVSGTILLVDKIMQSKVSRPVFLTALVILSLGLGFLRYAVKDFHIPNDELHAQVGEQVELMGVVVREPERRDNDTRYVLATRHERILVSTDLYSEVAYGDEVSVAGKLSEPGLIESEDGRDFDYAEYLSKDDIYYTISFAKTSVVSSGHGNFFKQNLFRLKHSLVSNMKKVFAEPESSLLAGLIVSGKDAMPKGILEEFRRAGVVHIVVLSGYNITIIADFIRKFFETVFIHSRVRLMRGPQLSALASIAGIIGFILMTGAEPTVVRAGLMVLAVISAKMFGRTFSAPRALLLAAFIMILENPKILVFDMSFQLSFLATLALIYVSPVVGRYLHRVPEKLGLRTVLATTTATQTMVLPYLIYTMGDFSLVALLANVLILLIIPVTMLAGFLASLVAYVSSILALPFSYVAHLLLAWILGVSNYLGNLSFSTIKVSTFPFWITLLMYLGLFILWKRLQNSPQHSAN